jgi:hypothetical protein
MVLTLRILILLAPYCVRATRPRKGPAMIHAIVITRCPARMVLLQLFAGECVRGGARVCVRT